MPNRAYRRRWRGWRAFVNSAAHLLRATEDPRRIEQARHFEACGRMGYAAGCGACQTELAIVVVPTWCNLRICPGCARKRSQRLFTQLVDAVNLVPTRACELARAKLPELVALRDHKRERARAWSGEELYRFGPTPSKKWRARCAAYAASARRAANSLTAWIGHLNRLIGTEQSDDEAHAWRWRFLTLTREWDPSDFAAWEPDAMAARIRALWAQWAAVWPFINAHGVAAATAKIELSDDGFIHLHVLYFGPYVSHRKGREGASWLEQTQRDAVPGAGHSFIKETYGGPRGAAAEAGKYVAKLCTPLATDWLGGEPRLVLNPRVAVNWQIATERMQLVRHFGLMREVIGEDAEPDELAPDADDDKPRTHKCTQCAQPIGSDYYAAPFKPVRVSTIARALWRAARDRALNELRDELGERVRAGPQWRALGFGDAAVKERIREAIAAARKEASARWRELAVMTTL